MRVKEDYKPYTAKYSLINIRKETYKPSTKIGPLELGRPLNSDAFPIQNAGFPPL